MLARLSTCHISLQSSEYLPKIYSHLLVVKEILMTGSDYPEHSAVKKDLLDVSNITRPNYCRKKKKKEKDL